MNSIMTMFPSVTARSFRAMGCRASVSVVASDRDVASRLADLAVRRVAHLERCWTRFDDDSDLAAINHAQGGVVRVDPSTIDLVRAMIVAHRLTRGSCDAAHRSGRDVEPGAIDRIRFDQVRQLVCVPAGLELDPGSVGKGLAADLVARQLTSAGADGALVEIGGDLRATGDGPHLGFWSIGVEDPFDGVNRGGSVLVQEGGVSTSGLVSGPEFDGPDNVSVDPRTGRPLRVDPTCVVSATVIAGTALEAEMWSTTLLVKGVTELDPVTRRGCIARATTGNGHMHSTTEWKRIFTPDPMLCEVAHV